MSVDFRGVKEGDRIKLTRKNGDEFTFTVDEVPLGGVVYDEYSNAAYCGEWDTLEIPPKPLPTRYGAMVASSEDLTYYVLNSAGEWISEDGYQVASSHVEKALVSGFRVVFEGITEEENDD